MSVESSIIRKWCFENTTPITFVCPEVSGLPISPDLDIRFEIWFKIMKDQSFICPFQFTIVRQNTIENKESQFVQLFLSFIDGRRKYVCGID